MASISESIVNGQQDYLREFDPAQLKKPTFTAREIASVRELVTNVQRHSLDTGLAFDPGSGALLYRGGIIEMAGPGLMQALVKIGESPK